MGAILAVEPDYLAAAVITASMAMMVVLYSSGRRDAQVYAAMLLEQAVDMEETYRKRRQNIGRESAKICEHISLLRVLQRVVKNGCRILNQRFTLVQELGG